MRYPSGILLPIGTCWSDLDTPGRRLLRPSSVLCGASESRRGDRVRAAAAARRIIATACVGLGPRLGRLRHAPIRGDRANRRAKAGSGRSRPGAVDGPPRRGWGVRGPPRVCPWLRQLPPVGTGLHWTADSPACCPSTCRGRGRQA